MITEQILIPNILQVEALEKIEKFSDNRGTIIMPTGTGKTFLAVLWFKKKLEANPNSKLLFICHNNDILSQANEREFKETLLKFNIKVGYYNRDEKNIQQATFGTVQTLARNLSRLKPEQFDYIIIDEAHHYQAETFKRVANFFKPKFLLGLTATPYRMDGKKIFEICGKPIYESKIKDAIDKGLLTKIKYFCVDNDIDFSDIKWNGSGYDEKDLNRKICIKEYDDAILKEYTNFVLGKRKKTICFCATVEHVHRIVEVFNKGDIRAVGLTGRNVIKEDRHPRGDRKKIIEDFKDGKYDIICVVNLFNEGINIPDADCILMLRPTQSHTIFTQQIGRGLRLAEGKENLLVLDFTGNARRCIINFEVLEEMTGLNIIEKVKMTSYHENTKKGIEFLFNGHEINLSKKKVEIIEKYTLYTKNILIKNYNEVKEKLGKKPNPTDMHKYKLDISPYKRLWGSWAQFKDYMGDSNIVTQDKVKEQFREFFNKYNKYPTTRDLRKNKMVSDNTVRKLFGSIAKAIEHCGGKVNHYYVLDIDKDRLIKDYKNLREKLGRTPKQAELEKYVPYSFSSHQKRHFGFASYLKFLDKMGDLKEHENLYKPREMSREETFLQFKIFRETSSRQPTSDLYFNIKKHFGNIRKMKKEMDPQPNKKELKKIFKEKKRVCSDFNDYVKEYHRIKEIIGKKPIFKEIQKYSNFVVGDYKVSPFTNYGKGYISFLEEIGENPNKIYIKKIFLSTKTKLGRTPKQDEIGISSHYFKKHYGGGYRDFLSGMGEPLYAYHKKVSDKEILDKFNEIRVTMGIPTTNQLKLINKKLFGLIVRRFDRYSNFLIKNGFNKHIENNPNYTKGYKNRLLTKEEMFAEYMRIKKLTGKKPTMNNFNRDKIASFSYHLIKNRFGNCRFRVFQKYAEEWIKNESSKNITIIPNYQPKTVILPTEKEKRHFKGLGGMRWKNEGYKTTDEKVEIRKKIISKIKDGDNILILESPELEAIKEIERQGIKPNSITIPNNHEFNKVVTAFKNYKTDLNIKLVNTSVLQYLVDSDEKLDFLWLDYCGAFSFYMKDLDILFAKHLENIRLILTYNIFDPEKENETHYFTQVIDYVLQKSNNKIRIIKDISYRYKKNMYNIGFDIQNPKMEGIQL